MYPFFFTSISRYFLIFSRIIFSFFFFQIYKIFLPSFFFMLFYCGSFSNVNFKWNFIRGFEILKEYYSRIFMFDFEKKKETLIPTEEWKIIPPGILQCVWVYSQVEVTLAILFLHFFPTLFISIFLHSCRILAILIFVFILNYSEHLSRVLSKFLKIVSNISREFPLEKLLEIKIILKYLESFIKRDK